MKPMMHVVTALILLSASAAESADIVGQVRSVIDGDDILVCSSDGACRDIRLCGIDAPENTCPRYGEAKAAMRDLVEGKQVRCVPVGSGSVCDGRSQATNRNRIVAQCFQETTDVAAALVARGLACDWVRFSGGHYSKGGKSRPCPANHRATCGAAQRVP